MSSFLKTILKRLPYYREVRYLYRAFFVYRKINYIYYRFWIGPQIRKFQVMSRNVSNRDYSVHFLCSHDDLTMLFWSLASWYKAVPRSGQVFIHEDGSFTAEDRKLLGANFPNVELVDYAWATRQAAATWLRNYPEAKKYRCDRHTVFATKLIDPFFVSEASRRLLLDCDVLFFGEPTQLLNLIEEGRSFFMAGRSQMPFEFKDSSRLSQAASSINAGIIGYDSANYDPDDLEEFCQRLGPQSNLYFFEQAGHAFVLQKKGFTVLDQNSYIIKGVASPGVEAKHYTGPRREQFWFEGVRGLHKNLME